MNMTDIKMRGLDHVDPLATKFRQESRNETPERAARRESFMVRRQQPVPVLKPSLDLAMGPDREAFNAQWRSEQVYAGETKTVRANLVAAHETVSREIATIDELKDAAGRGEFKRVDREIFKSLRRVADGPEKTLQHARAFRRAHGGR